MFVGYVDDHAGDVYRFMNEQTKRIILSRDAKRKRYLENCHQEGN